MKITAILLWKIEDGGIHYVAAVDQADAIAVMAEGLYESVEAYIEECEPKVTPVDGNEIMVVMFADEKGQPTETKTCREWCEGGRGVVSTSEY